MTWGIYVSADVELAPRVNAVTQVKIDASS